MEVGFQYSLSIKTSTLLKPFRQQKRDIDISLNGAFKSFGLFSNTICKSLMNRLHSTLFVDQLKSYNRYSMYISQSSPLVQRIWTSRTILLLDNKFCLHPTQHSLYGQLTYSLFIYAAAPSIQYGHGTLVKQGVDCLQSMQPVPKIYVFSYSQTNVNANLLQIEHSDASRPTYHHRYRGHYYYLMLLKVSLNRSTTPFIESCVLQNGHILSVDPCTLTCKPAFIIMSAFYLDPSTCKPDFIIRSAFDPWSLM